MLHGTQLAYDHDSLSKGLSLLLRGLRDTDESHKRICASFDLVTKGLGAGRAGLFFVRHAPEGIHLEALCSVGFSNQQIRALECSKDGEQPGPSQVWKVIADQEQSCGPGEGLSETIIQAGTNLQVICMPVRDRILDVPVAVIYIEKNKDDNSLKFGAQEEEWIENYGLALSQVIHLGFRQGDDERTALGDFAEIREPKNAPDLIGDSVHTQALRNELQKVHIPAASAPDPDPILILGEKGTGKDLVARYIYACSSRRNQPYVAVNCAEITDELAAARFFGHKRGAFTGSLANEPGLFRAADQGVLFLDEIGDLSLRAQGTLLRVLENRTVVPLGETRETRVNVQVILATNCDPERAVAERVIRADLLDRFKTQEIQLVPLRERPWDIPALVRHFIAHHEKRTQKRTHGLHPDVLRIMVGYSWPGNVRELARVCSLLVTHTNGDSPIGLPLFNRLLPHITDTECNPKAGAMMLGDVPMRDALEMFGRELILARLRQHNGNVRSARESLGLPKTTFHRYARALGIAGSVRAESGRSGVDVGFASKACGCVIEG